MTESAPDVESLSFEQARDELVRVVAELEQGTPTLEHSLALWERGEALAARCEEWLLGPKRRLEAARSAGASSAAPEASVTAGSASRGSGAG
jgi:exodeoxyribonuclease VII small subunit